MGELNIPSFTPQSPTGLSLEIEHEKKNIELMVNENNMISTAPLPDEIMFPEIFCFLAEYEPKDFYDVEITTKIIRENYKNSYNDLFEIRKKLDEEMIDIQTRLCSLYNNKLDRKKNKITYKMYYYRIMKFLRVKELNISKKYYLYRYSTTLNNIRICENLFKVIYELTENPRYYFFPVNCFFSLHQLEQTNYSLKLQRKKLAYKNAADDIVYSMGLILKKKLHENILVYFENILKSCSKKFDTKLLYLDDVDETIYFHDYFNSKYSPFIFSEKEVPKLSDCIKYSRDMVISLMGRMEDHENRALIVYIICARYWFYKLLICQKFFNNISFDTHNIISSMSNKKIHELKPNYKAKSFLKDHLNQTPSQFIASDAKYLLPCLDMLSMMVFHSFPLEIAKTLYDVHEKLSEYIISIRRSVDQYITLFLWKLLLIAFNDPMLDNVFNFLSSCYKFSGVSPIIEKVITIPLSIVSELKKV